MKDNKPTVLLKINWEEDSKESQLQPKPNQNQTQLLDELANVEHIARGLLEKIMKGNAIKESGKRTAYFRKVRFEIKEQLSNFQYVLSPLLSKDKLKKIQAVFTHFIQYLDERINNTEEYANHKATKPNQTVADKTVDLDSKLDTEKLFLRLSEVVKSEIARDKAKGSQSIDVYLSREEVAGLLKVSKVTVNTWMKSGKLPYTRIGRRVLFKKEEIDSLLKPINQVHERRKGGNHSDS